ncbi:hypothetical protein D0C16_23810 [Cellvibrio sp. KY-GH-1]|uniref:hypothetical protein n=1 Tax=Cellvibrio sp. KY-GH-1 TaxID=2303332 RepID=UPI001248D42E|nr:hypothetical protein [Cellvibrio sp. KY-GH-1]QEY18742.1 hypothetical protein D0C16_23810 [Cellvibrio sp. KY-GH-1]
MSSWFLSNLNPWPLILGLAVMIIGIALLYRAWQKPARNWSLISLGWIALLLVHWPLGIALSLDRGWAIAAILPGFIALLWIAMTTPWRDWNIQGRQKPVRTANSPAVPASTRVNQTGQVLLQILVVGLLSFAAAIGVALALFSLLEGSVINRTVFAALLVMVLWPALMVWSKANDSLLKPAMYFAGITLGGLLFTPVFFLTR